MVHGAEWTLKELFVFPNEFVYWTIQIVMYPFMTGLVAGAFVLSSLYHVFGVKALKDVARFALVFSFALLPVAMLPLLLHLQQPLRALNVLLTPHFSSAISAFGIVFMTYGAIVSTELWFVYRPFFVRTAQSLSAKKRRRLTETVQLRLFSLLCLGAHDLTPLALARDEKALKVVAAIGIPVAFFLHGYAGFIFGSVKANALWMTPLMPVLFILSAVVSGIAICMLCYITVMEIRRFTLRRRFARRYPRACSLQAQRLRGVEEAEVRITARWLVAFLVVALLLELLDVIFRGYTAMKSWDILREVIYRRDFFNIFVLQYGLGSLLPLVLLLLPRLTVRRALAAAVLVLGGVFMMRWNVVIGGQAFSLSTAGFMHYELPIVPRSLIALKEGAVGAAAVLLTPFLLFWLFNRIFPVFPGEDRSDLGKRTPLISAGDRHE
ncbi:MAG: polysulfide reductase NrfD [Desulfuromonadales bacterium]|nr:polysulfide reductase NrfD [Desulfuromonadales bacterium]